MGTKILWFCIGAAAASAVWLAVLNGINVMLLEQLLGARSPSPSHFLQTTLTLFHCAFIPKGSYRNCDLLT